MDNNKKQNQDKYYKVLFSRTILKKFLGAYISLFATIGIK